MQKLSFPSVSLGDYMLEISPVTEAANLMPIANRLSLEAIGVWFKLQLVENMFDGLEDNDEILARHLGLDPRVWRRNRAELERAGVLTTEPVVIAA